MKRSSDPGSSPFHVKRIALAPVRAYQRWISPARPRRCRYEPTCSAYAVESVERFGVLRGAILAMYRLLRCNPFSDGGFDPVPDHFTLRGLGHIHPADYHGEGLAGHPRGRVASTAPSGRRTQGGLMAAPFGRLRTPPREVCAAPSDVRGDARQDPKARS